MEQFPDLLRTELLANLQTCNVLKKLDHNGSTKSIWTLLLKLFEDEGLYIIEKLSKSNDEHQEEAQLRKNFEIDLTLFKEGLTKIVQASTEHLFKLVLLKPNYMDKETYISTTQSQKHINDNMRNLSVSQIHQISSSEISSDAKYNVKSNLMKISVPNRSISTISREGRRSNSIGNHEFHHYRPVAKIDQSFYERLTSKQGRRRAEEDSYQNVSIQLPYINKSILLKEPQRQQYFRIQSEFNHIKGAVKFGSSKRKVFEDKQFSPGPANYSMESSRTPVYKKAPTPTIGKANRKTWIEIALTNDSPGPANFYPSKHLVLK